MQHVHITDDRQEEIISAIIELIERSPEMESVSICVGRHLVRITVIADDVRLPMFR